jgi:hypothetical protein
MDAAVTKGRDNMGRRIPVSEDKRMVDCIGCITYHPNTTPKRVFPHQKCSYCGTITDENGWDSREQLRIMQSCSNI